MVGRDGSYRTWCYWHMDCVEFRLGCSAHLHEARFFECPYAEPPKHHDKYGWVTKCADYEPRLTEDGVLDQTGKENEDT